MSAELRELFYPLGFLSSLAFTLRFLTQWLFSEMRGESLVSKSFWWLSLLGNFSLMAHSAIQLQYPICVIQSVNIVISVRNLNLLQGKARSWNFFPTVFCLTLLALLLPTLGFYFWSGEEWWRVPTHLFASKATHVTLLWHFFGFLGVLLYASRFWIQWIEAERAQQSRLDTVFWWLSIVGALLSLAYFLKIRDLVNMAGPLFGIVPYIRNLMLLKKKKVRYEHS